MHRITSAMWCFIVGIVLVPTFARSAEEAHRRLQGIWTATTAERDGKAADDVVGHRLSFTGNRFEIKSKDGKTVNAGAFQVNARAKPAAIDFEHTEGNPQGKYVEGDLRAGWRHAENMRQRTQHDQEPAGRIRGKEWVWLCAHQFHTREALNRNCLS